LGLWAVPQVPSQDPTPEYVEVRLVQIEARVTGKDGKSVVGLTREDFRVKEDGVPKEVRGLRYVGGREVPASKDATPEPDEAKANGPGGLSADEPTWVYIACEFGSGSEFSRAFPSLRQFVEEQRQPSLRISIAGMPFTGNKTLLEAILDRMENSPYGRDTVKPSIDHSVAHMTDLELERRLAEELQNEQGQVSLLPGFGRDRTFIGRIDAIDYYSVERIDRQLPLYGRLALYRYRELIEKISLLPGKKMIVLFRPGLPLDKDTTGLMEEVVSLAVRHRISFYTMDPKGLETGIDVDSPKAALPWAAAAGRRRARGAVLTDQSRAIDYQSGLASLASGTGGKAVENLNDMGAVLKAVSRDAGGYYVLDYRPEKSSNPGRFRKVEVTVGIPGVRVDAVKGYYEPDETKADSKQEKELALYRALLSGSSQQFPINGTIEFFADSQLDAFLVSSVGAHPMKLSGSPEKLKDTRFEMAALTRLRPLGLTQLPTYGESRATYSLTRADLESATQDETAQISLNSEQKLIPGAYRWQAALQNLDTGGLGSLEQMVTVPDFKRPSTPSSLLLTRRVERIEPAEKRKTDTDLLTAGDLRYVPEPGNAFRQGDVVFILLHLYSPSESDCAIAQAGMQMALLQGDTPVLNARAGGRAFISEDRTVIRYAAYIETASLAPGEYRVLALLPNFQARKPGHVEDSFVVLPPVK